MRHIRVKHEGALQVQVEPQNSSSVGSFIANDNIEIPVPEGETSVTSLDFYFLD